MPSEHNMHRNEHDMHRNKPFITNDTAQGLLVNVMGHHQETLICMALNMVADMVMGATLGARAGVDATDSEAEEPYLS